MERIRGDGLWVQEDGESGAEGQGEAGVKLRKDWDREGKEKGDK